MPTTNNQQHAQHRGSLTKRPSASHLDQLLSKVVTQQTFRSMTSSKWVYSAALSHVTHVHLGSIRQWASQLHLGQVPQSQLSQSPTERWPTKLSRYCIGLVMALRGMPQSLSVCAANEALGESEIASPAGPPCVTDATKEGTHEAYVCVRPKRQ